MSVGWQFLTTAQAAFSFYHIKSVIHCSDISYSSKILCATEHLCEGALKIPFKNDIFYLLCLLKSHFWACIRLSLVLYVYFTAGEKQVVVTEISECMVNTKSRNSARSVRVF